MCSRLLAEYLKLVSGQRGQEAVGPVDGGGLSERRALVDAPHTARVVPFSRDPVDPARS